MGRLSHAGKRSLGLMSLYWVLRFGGDGVAGVTVFSFHVWSFNVWSFHVLSFHRSPAFECTSEGDFIGVLQFTAYGQAVGDSSHLGEGLQ